MFIKRNDPTLGAIRAIMEKSEGHRKAVEKVNETFGFVSRESVMHKDRASYDSAVAAIEAGKEISEEVKTILESYRVINEATLVKVNGKTLKFNTKEEAQKFAARERERGAEVHQKTVHEEDNDCDDKGHSDEKEDKKLVKSMVKKDALKESNWIKGAIKHPGALTRAAKAAGETNAEYEQEHKHDKGLAGERSRLALTLKHLNENYKPITEGEVVHTDFKSKKVTGKEERSERPEEKSERYNRILKGLGKKPELKAVSEADTVSEAEVEESWARSQEDKSGKKGKARDLISQRIKQKREQINELSKETLTSYKEKATQSRRDHDKAADAFLAGAEKLPRFSDMHDKHLDRADHHSMKAFRRKHGIKAAEKKLSEDELNELSKDTLKSYVKGAADDLLDSSTKSAHAGAEAKSAKSTTSVRLAMKTKAWHDERVNRRIKGIGKAVSKLSEESVKAEIADALMAKYDAFLLESEKATFIEGLSEEECALINTYILEMGVAPPSARKADTPSTDGGELKDIGPTDDVKTVDTTPEDKTAGTQTNTNTNPGTNFELPTPSNEPAFASKPAPTPAPEPKITAPGPVSPPSAVDTAAKTPEPAAKPDPIKAAADRLGNRPVRPSTSAVQPRRVSKPLMPNRHFGFGQDGSGSDDAGAITNRAFGAVNEEIKTPVALDSVMKLAAPKKAKKAKEKDETLNESGPTFESFLTAKYGIRQ